MGYDNASIIPSAREVHILKEHVHSAQMVYPSLAGGTTVTSSAVAWTLGGFQEIIPVNTITDFYDIHWITVEGISADAIFEIVLYKGLGGAEIEIGRGRFAGACALLASAGGGSRR